MIVSPHGFRQPKNPSKEKMKEAALEATDLAAQGAAIITQLLIERSTMDKLVDNLISGAEGAKEAIEIYRKERLEI